MNKLTVYNKAYRFEENGWIYIHIEGEPYTRGFQHGFLLAKEIEDALKTARFMCMMNTGKNYRFFTENAVKMFVPKISREYIEEMRGIAAGVRKAGVSATFSEIVAWNGYSELTNYWWPSAKKRYLTLETSKERHCSAFVAAGSATKEGKIVMAHNSWDDFVNGQYFNIVMDIECSDGNRILMQSVPGHIDSFTDFFISSAGIIGTETSIGGFMRYDTSGAPEFFRVRKAMQYGKNIDEWVSIISRQNNGGNASNWLLGDINTGEIARFEQGLEYTNLEKKTDGYFTAFNTPDDPRIRNLECGSTGCSDIRKHNGATRLRWHQIMTDPESYGKIDSEMVKNMLADHYDVYLNRESHPCSRTICGHYDLDAGEFMSQDSGPEPYSPRGTVDGKVLDTDLAKNMSFWARFGNSCGMDFNAKEFLKKHPQWDWQKDFLKDRPGQPWTLFASGAKKEN